MATQKINNYLICKKALPSWHELFKQDSNDTVSISELNPESRYESDFSKYPDDCYISGSVKNFSDGAHLFPGTYAGGSYPWVKTITNFPYIIDSQLLPYSIGSMPGYNRELTDSNASVQYSLVSTANDIDLYFYPSKRTFKQGKNGAEISYGNTNSIVFALISAGGKGTSQSSSTATDGTRTIYGGGGGGGGCTIHGIIDLARVTDGDCIRYNYPGGWHELCDTGFRCRLKAYNGGDSSKTSSTVGSRGSSGVGYINSSKIQASDVGRCLSMGNFDVYIIEVINGTTGASGAKIVGTSGSGGSSRSYFDPLISTDTSKSGGVLCQTAEDKIYTFELDIPSGGGGAGAVGSLNSPSGSGGIAAGQSYRTPDADIEYWGRGGSGGQYGNPGALFLWY